MPEARKALVVELEQADFNRIAPFLGRSTFDVDRFPRARAALDLVTQVRFDLLLLRFPVTSIATQSFLETVRERTSASRKSPLLLVAARKDVAEAETFVGRGANQVIRLDQDEAELQSIVSRLLAVAPRQNSRLPVRIEVHLSTGKDVQLSQTVNLSATGMLIETDRRPKKGARFRFQLQHPDGPIAGVAEVTRHATPARDRIEGLGLRFVSFADEAARQRLYAYLHHARSSG